VACSRANFTLLYISVVVSTGTEKCGFCAKSVILGSICGCVILMCCTENSQELPEDGVGKRRNAPVLKVDQPPKK
jgi:hypothetical protein